MTMLRSVPTFTGLLCVISTLAGCTFESTGRGASGDSLFSEDGSEDGDSGASDTDSDAGMSDADTGGDGGGDGEGGHDENGDDGGTETEGDIDCSSEVTFSLPVQSALVLSPMEKAESGMGEGIYARSLIAEQGSVEFTFELPCAGEFTIWGRVNDFFPGSYPADPDSYFVRLDDEPISTWFYGCQTAGARDQWNWIRVESGIENSLCSEATRLTARLDSGTHTLRLHNREGVNSFGEFAAVARIILTNNPRFVPGSND